MFYPANVLEMGKKVPEKEEKILANGRTLAFKLKLKEREVGMGGWEPWSDFLIRLVTRPLELLF